MNRPPVVAVIDTATKGFVTLVPLGSISRGVAITQDGALAYMVNFISNALSAVDLATNTVVATVAVGRAPSSVAITPGP